MALAAELMTKQEMGLPLFSEMVVGLIAGDRPRISGEPIGFRDALAWRAADILQDASLVAESGLELPNRRNWRSWALLGTAALGSGAAIAEAVQYFSHNLQPRGQASGFLPELHPDAATSISPALAIDPTHIAKVGAEYSVFNPRPFDPTDAPTRKPGETPTIGITATAVQTDEVNQVPGRAWSRGEHPGDDWWEPWSKTFADGKVVIDGIKLNLGDLKTRIELTTVEALQDYRIIIEGEDEPQPITGVGGYSAEVPTPSDSPYKSFRIYGLEVGGETDLGIHWVIFNRQDGKVDSMFFGWQPAGDTNGDIIDAVAWKLGITGKQIGLEVDAQGQPIIVAKGKYDRVKGEWVSVEVQLPGDKNNWIEAGIQALLDLDPQLRIAEAAEGPTVTPIPPTPEPTATSVPPTPEPTEKPKPLYSECGPNPKRLGETLWTDGKYYYEGGYPKGVDGRPLPTGAFGNEKDNGPLTMLHTFVCLSSTVRLTTLVEENDSITTDMTVFDIYGQKHTYPILWSGQHFRNRPNIETSVCEGGTCSITPITELFEKLASTISLKNNSKIFQVDFVVKNEGTTWLNKALAEKISDHSEANALLANALKTGKDFPPDGEALVYVWQTRIPDQTPDITPTPTGEEGVTP